MPDSREPQLDELRRRARRRLIGAVVLALAAAVLVPLLLESDPKPLGEDVAVKIPPVGEGKFAAKVGEKRKAPEPAAAPAPTPAPEPKDAANAPAEAPQEAAKAPAEPAKDASQSPAAKSLASAEQRVLSPPSKAPPAPAPAKAAQPAPAPPPATAPAKTAPAASAPAPKAAEPAPKPAEAAPKSAEADKGSGFSVQLAAFTDDKGANALAAKLKKLGYPAYTEPYETSRGKLWRVRVGPYPGRDAAEGARAKLKAEGQSGFIAAAK